MDDLYFNKYNKYKTKYILLQEIVKNNEKNGKNENKSKKNNKNNKKTKNNKKKYIQIEDFEIINDKTELTKITTDNTPDWPTIGNSVRNSVVQIITINYRVDPSRPYLQPKDRRSRGSGFIITSTPDKVLIMTNAHVVDDAENIIIRTEQTKNIDLKGEVIGICLAKDLALITLDKSDIKKLNPLPKALYFKDDRNFMDTIPVLVVGYPLGMENIKFTTGVLSGNQTEYNLTYDRAVSYLQVSAAINPGNSGGPLFNSEGEIIGVNSAGYTFSQNIAYAIPTHTIITVLNDLLTRDFNDTKIVRTPNYGFRWNSSSKQLIESLGGSPTDEGIYISKISNSGFLKLKKGDILCCLEFSDICSIKKIWQIIIDKKINQDELIELYDSANKVRAEIDNFGIIKLYENNKEHKWSTKRKLSIDELLDSITNNSNVKITVIRNNKKIDISTNSKIIKSEGIGPIAPIYEKLDWEICLGCCFTPLSAPLIKRFDESDNDLERFLMDEYRYKNWIAITNIFPETEAYASHIIDEGDIDIIFKICDTEVRTMNEVRNVLEKNKGKYISIDFEDGKRMVVSDIDGNARNTDKTIYKEQNIKYTDFAKNIWFN